MSMYMFIFFLSMHHTKEGLSLSRTTSGNEMTFLH